MDRSRSKRIYYEPDSPPPRSRPRYNENRRRPDHHHRRDRRLQPGPPPPFIPPGAGVDGGPPPGAQVTTFYRILCPESKFDEFLGDSIAQIQAQTRAWIGVHRPFPGDSVRVLETSDAAVREPDGRPPQFSPAQDALIMLHRVIVDAPDEEERERKATSRMVVPKLHVGCLLGKGGKIIEMMRMETGTHIRVLPRDAATPRCVSVSEEVLQVTGDSNSVKRAIAIISDRLKESMHRDRGPFRERDRHFPQDDDFIPNPPNLPAGDDYNNNNMLPNGGPFRDFGNNSLCEAIVFRILCPNNKVEGFISNGVFDMLKIEVGVEIGVCDSVNGSDDCVIVITSKEDPEDELFPAQEALLHIQSQIVDVGPDKDNIISTRLLVPSKEIEFLNGPEDLFSQIKKTCFANVRILPKEDVPSCASDSDELVQIVGEIRDARNALVQVTEKIRSFIYREFYLPNDILQGPYSDNISPKELYYPQNIVAPGPWNPKDMGPSGGGYIEQETSNGSDLKRFGVPVVTKSTLEVIIPQAAVEILAMRSRNKLAQISEISGAAVILIEETDEVRERVVRISGSPEQADKAQSLLQGFILSIQDDLPSS